MNRHLIDGISNLYFAPTAMSENNLIKENVSKEKIHVTGNTAMIAQAILESVSGTSQLTIEQNFNIFRIKGTKSCRAVCLQTFEDTGNGEMISI